jgi:hypothetical protein
MPRNRSGCGAKVGGGSSPSSLSRWLTFGARRIGCQLPDAVLLGKVEFSVSQQDRSECYHAELSSEVA